MINKKRAGTKMYKFKVYDKLNNKVLNDIEVSNLTVTDLNNKDRFIVNQWSGLTDNNNEEIYSGQTVRVNDKGRHYKVQKVVFKDGAFCGFNEKKTCKYTLLDILVKWYGCEIIKEGEQ